MKKYLKSVFAAAAVMFVFSIFAATETKAQNILPEILKRMNEHQKALKSLKANVLMDKFNSQLQTNDISEGIVHYVPAKGRDALVRIDWTKPAEETLAVANGQYVMYTPRTKRAITGSTKNPQGSVKTHNALAFMSMSTEQLRANYAVKYLGPETVSGGAQTWHLELTPKTAQSYKSAEIWVDQNGMPIQAKVIENNSDATTVLLSNLQKNLTIDGAVFKLKLPKDINIVKS